jgi:hypothetical protein
MLRPQKRQQFMMSNYGLGANKRCKGRLSLRTTKHPYFMSLLARQRLSKTILDTGDAVRCTCLALLSNLRRKNEERGKEK